jgi:adenylate kinase
MAAPELRAVLLFGAPGVGKGTQGRRLAARPNFYHLSTGDMFRSLDPDSPLGREVRGYTEQGELVPDELTMRIFRDAVRRLSAAGKLDPGSDTLVLDGIPRNVNQARALDDEVSVAAIVHLVNRNDEAMLQRMKRRAELEGRQDDLSESVIRRRFDVYRAETRPVLDHYPSELVLEIDALGEPDEIAARIEEGLRRRWSR